MNRLRAGYVKWINPFNRKEQFISFEKTKFIVFWTNNPRPLLKHLSEIERMGIGFYFHFTLNDYVEEGLEPNLPGLSERIDIFKELSRNIGKERVIWRFDPLILTDKIDLDILKAKIKRVGDDLFEYTKKLIFSYADIAIYQNVKNNLKRSLIKYKEFDFKSMRAIAERIRDLNMHWNLELATCAENMLLNEFGINQNKCIDDSLILKLAGNGPGIRNHFEPEGSGQLSIFQVNRDDDRDRLKDKGQRPECGCVLSKDIGQYNTCGHLCLYCYANHSAKTVKDNLSRTNIDSPSII